jgi:hypothetical protein
MYVPVVCSESQIERLLGIVYQKKVFIHSEGIFCFKLISNMLVAVLTKKAAASSGSLYQLKVV